MILYLDTSAVVKLYASEPGSGETGRLVAKAKRIASNPLAYAETGAALARKYRTRQITRGARGATQAEFELHWAGFFKLPVDLEIAPPAGGRRSDSHFDSTTPSIPPPSIAYIARPGRHYPSHGLIPR